MRNWTNLKRNKCPDCKKLLEFNKNEEMIYCGDINCGFQISQYRMETLVTQMNKRKMPAVKDNMLELNNFDHEPLGEGFEDLSESDEMFDSIGI